MRASRHRCLAAAATIMLAGAGGAPARSPAASTRGSVTRYDGHTGQMPGLRGVQRLEDNHVKLLDLAGRIRSFTIPWAAQCVDEYRHLRDAPLIDRSELDGVVLHHGRFDVMSSYEMSPGDRQAATVTLHLAGRIRGRRATGTLEVSAQIVVDGFHTNDFCGVTVHWQASAR